MLQINNISKEYITGNANRKVLNQLTLTVNKGDSVAIVGPSGSGKTTLLNIIGTLDKASSGTVSLNNINLMEAKADTLSEIRNKYIGMIFQLHHLLPQCSLWDNVLVPAILQKNNNSFTRAEELLKRTGIWEQRFQKPAELSGGECQRAAVVRALINEPSLILADEPTGALDHNNALGLTNLLLELNKEQGTALIVVTHSAEIAAKMDKTYQLDDGRLILV